MADLWLQSTLRKILLCLPHSRTHRLPIPSTRCISSNSGGASIHWNLVFDWRNHSCVSCIRLHPIEHVSCNSLNLRAETAITHRIYRTLYNARQIALSSNLAFWQPVILSYFWLYALNRLRRDRSWIVAISRFVDCFGKNIIAPRSPPMRELVVVDQSIPHGLVSAELKSSLLQVREITGIRRKKNAE